MELGEDADKMNFHVLRIRGQIKLIQLSTEDLKENTYFYFSNEYGMT